MAKITISPECPFVVVYRRKKTADKNRFITEYYYFKTQHEAWMLAQSLPLFKSVFLTVTIRRRGFRGTLCRVSKSDFSQVRK